MQFQFETDAESYEFFSAVVEQLVRLFGISKAEALGRVDRHMGGKAVTGHFHPIYHESPAFYAKVIYYGRDVHWWLDEVNCKPLPYP